MASTAAAIHSAAQTISTRYSASVSSFPCCTYGRITPRQGPELPLPLDLPAALVVIADAAGASGEDRGFHVFQGGNRHIKAQRIHR